ncbi:uncharacterized protein LOC101860211 [Aplysia californica]|uniref:Uncharacterized protein LOC101860211 n=1 Tax=Aplysia californica TaxID=6500 RepID=A0ABM1VRZ8_APLCA|nr:uncharacterized protein LOC101860211 [Aplysia californica]XP_005088894.1 uncharacterized protein LOC101860211 [Aplysia californica]XP_035825190.1 uncharacterized protein LOC101860211 [Aplysia californica]XP_035825210.1 uncharacterized protein LOC101860211 [Aplysia californica]XP_035825233.1 uncharacterized protein LOC101860211 [Aplysia californica]
MSETRSFFWRILVPALVMGVACIFLAPLVVDFVGFRKEGIAKKSLASFLQGTAVKANFGTSVISQLQRAGVKGFGNLTLCFIGLVGAAWTYINLLLFYRLTDMWRNRNQNVLHDHGSSDGEGTEVTREMTEEYDNTRVRQRTVTRERKLRNDRRDEDSVPEDADATERKETANDNGSD